MDGLSDLAKVLLLVAGFVGSYSALRQQWREDRPGFIKSIWALLGYAAYCGIGIAIMIWIVPAPSPARDRGGLDVAALMGFIIGWIFLGALWLARLAPRYQALQRWVDRRWGAIDLTLIAVIVVGFAVLLR